MEIKILIDDGDNVVILDREDFEKLKEIFQPEKEVVYIPTSPPMGNPYGLPWDSPIVTYKDSTGGKP